MAFTRADALGDSPDDELLTRRMVGIGMQFAAPGEFDASIEETLVHASSLGMDADDFRVLSVSTTWLELHHDYLHADRLIGCVNEHPSERVRAYWRAVSEWLSRDRRFKKLSELYDGPRVELLPVGTDFQISRRGEDERFANSVLKVPAGTLRRRASDVLDQASLVKMHAGYRNRVLMGPGWRADVWTEIEREPGLSISETARRAGCAYSTAWSVVRDFRLYRDALG